VSEEHKDMYHANVKLRVPLLYIEGSFSDTLEEDSESFKGFS